MKTTITRKHSGIAAALLVIILIIALQPLLQDPSTGKSKAVIQTPPSPTQIKFQKSLDELRVKLNLDADTNLTITDTPRGKDIFRVVVQEKSCNRLYEVILDDGTRDGEVCEMKEVYSSLIKSPSGVITPVQMERIQEDYNRR